MEEGTKVTQRMKIMRHLKDGKTLTGGEAWSKYGIIRLSARISELRKRGEPIEKRMITVENRNGELCRIAEYSLNQEERKA